MAASSVQPLLQILPQLADRNALLLHAVPVAHGDGIAVRGILLAQGVEIDGDAEGGADLVLAAVQLADGGGVVVDAADSATRLEHLLDLFGLLDDRLRVLL